MRKVILQLHSSAWCWPVVHHSADFAEILNNTHVCLLQPLDSRLICRCNQIALGWTPRRPARYLLICFLFDNLQTLVICILHLPLAPVSVGQYKYGLPCPQLNWGLRGSGKSSRCSICGSYYMQLVCRRSLPLAGTPTGSSNCGIHHDSRPQVLHALIKQRQRDVERGRDAAERMARLAHDLKVSNHQRDKLAQKFTAKERELGALENRVRPLAFYSFTEKSSSRSVCVQLLGEAYVHREPACLRELIT